MKFLNVISTTANLSLREVKISDEIVNFGQLSQYLLSLGHNIGGFKATWVAAGDPLHNSSPETAEATLPQTETAWLSLSPHTTDKGATYNEMKAFVKEARRQAEVNNDTNTFELIGDYTRLKTEEMERLYNRLQSTNDVVGISEFRITELERKVADLLSRVDDLEDRTSPVPVDEDEDDDFEEEDEDELDNIPDDVKRLWDAQGIKY